MPVKIEIQAYHYNAEGNPGNLYPARRFGEMRGFMTGFVSNDRVGIKQRNDDRSKEQESEYVKR